MTDIEVKNRPESLLVVSALTSTNAYALAGKFELLRGSAIIDINEKDVNAVSYKITACAVDSEARAAKNILCTDQPIAKNGGAQETVPTPYRWVYIYIKSTVAGVHGQVDIDVSQALA